MRESTLEKRTRLATERQGGVSLKLSPEGNTGVPDRLLLLPIINPEHRAIVAQYVSLVEHKAPGQRPRPKQEWWLARLQAMGYSATWSDT